MEFGVSNICVISNENTTNKNDENASVEKIESKGTIENVYESVQAEEKSYKRKKYDSKSKNQEIVHFSQEDSSSEIKTLLRDVSFAFNVLKITKESKQPNEKIFELTDSHINQFYAQGFVMNEENIDEAWNRSVFAHTGHQSYIHSIKDRLKRIYMIATVDVNYNFDVLEERRCSKCLNGKKKRGKLIDERTRMQCKRCAKKEVWDLLRSLEFFVLAARHQKKTIVSEEEEEESTDSSETKSIDDYEYVEKTTSRDQSMEESEEKTEEEEEEEIEITATEPVKKRVSSDIKNDEEQCNIQ